MKQKKPALSLMTLLRWTVPQVDMFLILVLQRTGKKQINTNKVSKSIFNKEASIAFSFIIQFIEFIVSPQNMVVHVFPGMI